MSTPYADDIFIYIGDRPVSLRDLGPEVDGPTHVVLQKIIDLGFAGDIEPGTPWYHVFEPNCIQTGSPPDEESEHLKVLYRDFKDYELKCSELSYKGKLTQDHRDELQRLHRAYLAMAKLTEA